MPKCTNQTDFFLLFVWVQDSQNKVSWLWASEVWRQVDNEKGNSLRISGTPTWVQKSATCIQGFTVRHLTGYRPPPQKKNNKHTHIQTARLFRLFVSGRACSTRCVIVVDHRCSVLATPFTDCYRILVFSNLKNSFIVPCGACRQFMSEVGLKNCTSVLTSEVTANSDCTGNVCASAAVHFTLSSGKAFCQGPKLFTQSCSLSNLCHTLHPW